jgi:hypothetical protein
MRHTTLLLAASLACLAPAARAQTPPGAGDARASFARAVTLYADGNYEAALVEFQRAQGLSRNPNLFYNLGAVYEALGRFVEARDALMAYRMGGTPSSVGPRAAELDARLARLRERIGTLRVTVPTPGLHIALDGQELAAERARAGVPVSAGRRRLRLDAPGHTTRELDVDVAGGGEQVISDGLDVRRAPLTLRSDTDEASVRVDGREVARTPVEGPVMLPEGTFQLEVTRPGYVSVRREVTLGVAGAVVDATLAWDPAMPPSVAAGVRVESNVDFPAVSVDGRSVVADGSTRVPAGRHQLRVAHEGYVPTTRAVSLSPGENTERVWLDATPQLRAEHADRVRRQRTVAYVIGGVGLAAMAGGAALLVTGLADRSAADDEVTRIADLKTCVMTNPGLCPPMSMLPAMLADSQDALRNATAWAITGGVVLGLGTAALVVGSVLRARSDPSDRYDRPAGWGIAVGFGGASLRGTF